jgi:hypothetical protein
LSDGKSWFFSVDALWDSNLHFRTYFSFSLLVAEFFFRGSIPVPWRTLGYILAWTCTNFFAEKTSRGSN